MKLYILTWNENGKWFTSLDDAEAHLKKVTVENFEGALVLEQVLVYRPDPKLLINTLLGKKDAMMSMYNLAYWHTTLMEYLQAETIRELSEGEMICMKSLMDGEIYDVMVHNFSDIDGFVIHEHHYHGALIYKYDSWQEVLEKLEEINFGDVGKVLRIEDFYKSL